ncbi:hypothetical protein [Methylomonas koyamae]|uniref:hypothetical protein n=1 Tax=Methylomonas koyamae TaxID=702114 RepID=UPI0006D1B4EE|nr:hypothetical protein [Methylomonas koyamae]
MAGAATVSAKSKQASTSTAKASVKGGKEDDGTQDGKVDQQTGAQRGVGDSVAAGKGARNSSSAAANPKAETANTDSTGQSSSDSISVAGAVALNIAESNVQGSTGVNRTVTASGSVAITASANLDAGASADGSAVSDSGSVGVAPRWQSTSARSTTRPASVRAAISMPPA